MISIKADRFTIQTDFSTGQMIFSASIVPGHKKQLQEIYAEMKDKPLRMDIRLWKDDRSVNANAFMWALCDKIAAVLKSTAVEVYREFIKRVGQYEVVPLRNDAIPTFMAAWERGDGTKKRYGRVAEYMHECNTEGYGYVKLYFGSSEYDTAQFSRLLDEIISEAEGIGIHTVPEDAKKAKEQFKHEYEKKQAS